MSDSTSNPDESRKKVFVDLAHSLQSKVQKKHTDDKSPVSLLFTQFVHDLENKSNDVFTKAKFPDTTKNLFDMYNALQDSENLNQALFQSMKSKSFQVVRILCENNADPQYIVDDKSILQYSAELKHWKELNLMCQFTEGLNIPRVFGESSELLTYVWNGLTSNNRLKKIDLSNNDLSNNQIDPLWKIIAEKNSVQSINLSGNNLTLINYSEVLIPWLSNSSCSLTSLNLQKNPIILDASFEIAKLHFQKNHPLKEYIVDHNDEINKNIEILKTDCVLSLLDFGMICAALDASKIKVLNISNTFIEMLVFRKIMEIIKSKPKQPPLSLSSENLSANIFKLCEGYATLNYPCKDFLIDGENFKFTSFHIDKSLIGDFHIVYAGDCFPQFNAFVKEHGNSTWFLDYSKRFSSLEGLQINVSDKSRGRSDFTETLEELLSTCASQNQLKKLSLRGKKLILV
eukprot:c21422_g1_i3.p1 GENE.c21422_g1_i3~~c21422_g1_i3.p1  ORF type:complete len:468 (+),score=79.10 c21422_g1_i3:31-1404(+)